MGAGPPVCSFHFSFYDVLITEHRVKVFHIQTSERTEGWEFDSPSGIPR